MQAFGVAHNQRGHLGLVLHQIDIATRAAIKLAHGALHLGMAAVPNQNALAAVSAVTRDLDMHFGDQRAGGIEYPQPARGGFLAHRLRHAVRAEYDDAVVGHLFQLLDENRSARAQIVHHVPVVHHLVAHVDRCAKHVQRAIDDINGAIDAGAKTPGIGQTNIHQCNSAGSTRCTCTSNSMVRPASG